MKLRLLAATAVAFTLGSGLALAQTAAPAPAAAAAPAVASDKATLSYALGYEFGAGLSDTKADVDISAVVRAVQDAYAKRAPTIARDKLAASLTAFQERMAAQQKAAYEKALRENKAKSDAFMAANRAKPGITSLPSGVQYRIIETGTGAKPNATSTVDLYMRGTLTSGEKFVDTYGTQVTSIKVSELPMQGLKEAVMLMPAGSRWEIFLPSDKAYGNDPRAPGGPGQALVFDLKVAAVK
jgi:peptidylprolyl isomerase